MTDERDLARNAWRGRLPSRYETDSWDRPFRRRLRSLLQPGHAVLDVGAGAHPTVPIAGRPWLREYVGLDIAASELAKAPAGSYSETSVHDLCEPNDALANRFDLVLSWFVLEHVSDLERALVNLIAYLRPDGTALLQLAGGRSPQALANRMLPHRVSVELLVALTDRRRDTVFPAYYDRCTSSGISAILGTMTNDFSVRPLYVGASYARFSGLLTRVYLAYEGWASRARTSDWASYYLVEARRDHGAQA